jgi:hypothetical protein
MHDLSDQRYAARENMQYKGKPIWSGNDHDGSRLFLGHIDSAVPQSVSIIDFCTRNNVHLESADHTFHQRFGNNNKELKEMSDLLGEAFSLQAHWFFFSLNSRQGPFTFPSFTKN